MNWLSENRHWLLFAGLVITGFGAVGTAIVGLVATASALLTGGPLVTTVGGFLLGTLLLVGLAIVFGVALASTLANRATAAVGDVSLPTNQRVANVFQGLESLVSPLSRLGLGDRFEPSVAERRAALTERYVSGELSEHELEAALSDVLDDHEEAEHTDRVGVSTPAVDPRDDVAASSTDTELETER